MTVLDWSQCPAVERIPGKVSGAWVLTGTRMPVATIFENLRAGASVDDVLRWYDGLDREPVQAVINFAARSLELPVRRLILITQPRILGRALRVAELILRRYCESVTGRPGGQPPAW